MTTKRIALAALLATGLAAGAAHAQAPSTWGGNIVGGGLAGQAERGGSRHQPRGARRQLPQAVGDADQAVEGRHGHPLRHIPSRASIEKARTIRANPALGDPPLDDRTEPNAAAAKAKATSSPAIASMTPGDLSARSTGRSHPRSTIAARDTESG